MYQNERPARLQRNFVQKIKPTKRGTSCCSGCGCALWALLFIIGVLVYPYIQRGLFSPVTPITQPICRQVRFFSSYAEIQGIPAMYFLVDRRSNSNWLAVHVEQDQFLWSDIGSVTGGIQDAAAQILQDGSLPLWVQDAINGAVRLAVSPLISQVVLFSPVLEDCSPEDQRALEHTFARDILDMESTDEKPDAVVSEETEAEAVQEQVVVYLGTVIAEHGANIRTGPSLEHEIATVLPHGHLVAYVAGSEDGEWLHLESGNWIFASLVATPEADRTLDTTDRAILVSEVPTPPSAPWSVALPTVRPPAADLNPTAEMAVLRLQALNHVNHARAREGLSPVFLGDNAAAQSHADEMAQHQYLSHWNLAGLTPDMRYTLAGGEAYSAENVAFIGNIVGPECIPYEPTEWLESTLDGLMESPGHRSNILRPEHTTLNLGISHDCRILTIVQLFEGEYVAYDTPPTIKEGQLLMQGHLHNGAILSRTGPAEGILISYWPPPYSLSRGQLFRTASYCSGAPIASILVPLPPLYMYDSDGASWSHTSCLTPYESDPQSQPPQTHNQARDLMHGAQQWKSKAVTYPRLQITPDIWQVDQNGFSVQADVSQIVTALGPGVYTILLWGDVNGTSVPVSKYAIFME